jgi:ACR3 family arsenite transporter
MISLGILVNIVVVLGVTYFAARMMCLTYEDAAPAAIIAGSNHFEVAIAVAISLFGITSGAALATVVGVLTEVPFMLILIQLYKATKSSFSRQPQVVPQKGQ